MSTRRFREHLIRDEEDLARHVDHIHYCPVKHGLVERPAAREWSTGHRYARERFLDDLQGDGAHL
ncbi:MAG: REP-associated tyrosine transposase, partial [Planctomycetota bacterium]